MVKGNIALILLLLGADTAPGLAGDMDTAAVLGGAGGAAVGSAVGDPSGAIIGARIGGALGAAVATEKGSKSETKVVEKGVVQVSEIHHHHGRHDNGRHLGHHKKRHKHQAIAGK
jgi:outer membrane lipoprotein SlyB